MSHSLVRAGNGGLRSLQRALRRKKYIHSRFILLMDSTVYQYCLPQLVSEVSAIQEADFLEIEEGEASKNIQIVAQLWEEFIEMQMDRHTVLITLGGGVVSDIGGFLAATYKRGIAHIAVPTTLVSMVDAALGGKNGINIGGIKNAVGTFYNPDFTFLYPDFINTLSDKQLLSGVAEMIKTALIADETLWYDMKEYSPLEIAKNHDWIYRCAELKLQIVRKDPQERSLRKILNFGHSIGHALEGVFIGDVKYHLSHGEAVAQGMYYAIKLSQRCKVLQENADSVLHYLKQYYPLTSLNDSTLKKVLRLLGNDKKNVAGEYRFVLLQSIGKPEADVVVSADDVIAVLQQE